MAKLRSSLILKQKGQHTVLHTQSQVQERLNCLVGGQEVSRCCTTGESEEFKGDEASIQGISKPRADIESKKTIEKTLDYLERERTLSYCK